MFGSSPSGANAYVKVGEETGVVAASPHKLIVMLFEGAIVAVKNAAECMKGGNIPGKGAAISKAIMIIDSGLRASLNKEVGGEIATNLDSLYEYMSMRLLTANLQNSNDMLNEVLKLLEDVKSAWTSIGETATAPAVADIPKAPSAYDSLAPKPTKFVSA